MEKPPSRKLDAPAFSSGSGYEILWHVQNFWLCAPLAGMDAADAKLWSRRVRSHTVACAAAKTWGSADPLFKRGAMAALLYCFCAGTALADRKSCIVLEQRYEQIKSAAGSVERNSLLFSAAAQNCLPLTRLLLDAGASLEARDRLGNMPLAIAAKSGRGAIVAHFLDHSAPVNARNLEGSTALYLAAETGRLAIAKLLVEHKADPNIIGRSGISPLGAAAYEGNTETCFTAAQ